MVRNKISVLVVEDETLLRLTTIDVLDDNGFQVHEAASADEAVDILESEMNIDILFTDIDMPGKLNGLDLVAHVLRENQDVAVLVTSGLTTPPAELSVEFLPKPYDFDDLPKRFLALKK